MAKGVSLAVSELQQHIQNSLVEGACGRFVPLSKVRSYYAKPNRVQDILDAFHHTGIPPLTILKNYTRVFTILVLIQKATYIGHFTSYRYLADDHLPFRSCTEWPEDCKEFSDAFFDEQWKFCPLELDKNRLNDTHLHDKIILPVTRQEILKKGVHSTTWLIEVYPEYDKLSDETSKPRNLHRYVLKSCRANEKESYVNELRAYTLLFHQDHTNTKHDTNEVSKHLLELHASWRIRGTFNLLLEWADKGSLDSYFERTKAPLREEEFFHFWSNLLLLIKPLQRIHELIINRQEQSVFQGIHQDITPRNILVASNGGPSDFDVTFKLADFGLTRFEEKPGKGKYMEGTDRRGTQMYSPPECVRNDSFLQRTILPAQPSIDIWAFACVLSEAAVWSSCGYDGITEYLESRRRETAQYKELHDEGYSACFHNGESILEAVMRKHQEIREAHRHTDRIVSEIITLVEDMLGDAASRPTAVAIYRRYCRIIKNAKPREYKEQSSESMQSPRPTYSGPRIFYTESEKNMQRQIPPEVPTGYPGSQSRAQNTAVGPSIDTSSISGQVTAPNGNIMDIGSLYTTAPFPQRKDVDQNRNATIEPLAESMPNLIAHSNVRDGQPYRHVGKQGAHCDRSFKEEVSLEDPPAEPPPKTGQHPSVENTSTTKALASKKTKPIPAVSVDEVYAWIKEKKNKAKNLKTRHSIQRLKGFEFLRELDRRDQIFLIDNSESMKPHWKTVIRVFKVLAYIAKEADPDNMELYFTNSKVRFQRKNRKELVKIIKKTDIGGQCNMRNRLARVLGKWIDEFEWSKKKRRIIPSIFSSRKQKDGVNIYIFTDGVWQEGPSPVCGVDEPIRDTVNNLLAKGIDKDHIGIQFISFGEDDIGIQRLLQLDRESEKFKIKKDIVDTEPCTGNVLKMLLGSFNPFFDGDGENAAPDVESPVTKIG